MLKKILLFLVLTLSAQNGLEIISVLAKEGEHKADIVHVIEEYLTSYLNGDLKGATQYISDSYFCDRGDVALDYFQFLTEIRQVFYKKMQRYTNRFYNNLKILEFSFQDNNAYLRVCFDFNGFNLDEHKWVNITANKQVVLLMEDGIWKITQWGQPSEIPF